MRGGGSAARFRGSDGGGGGGGGDGGSGELPRSDTAAVRLGAEAADGEEQEEDEMEDGRHGGGMGAGGLGRYAVGHGQGGLRRFSLPANAGVGIASGGSTLPPIRTQVHESSSQSPSSAFAQ